MNENVIDGETTEPTEVEQLQEALRTQATKAAYWRGRCQQLEDQVLELGIRAGDIRLAEQS